MSEETEKISELNYLSQCCRAIENKLSWGSPQQWTNSNFLDLSNEIKRASGIRISAATLKRIFGKVKTKEQYNPQLATKNALAQFLGFQSWSDYKIHNPVLTEMQVVEPGSLILLPETKKIKWGKLLALLSFLIVVPVAIWYFWPQQKINPEFSISGKYLEGKAYHTVVFDYDIEQVDSEEIYLDFGDSTRKALRKNTHTISHYYRSPGFYQVKLKIDDQVYYDTSVFLGTKDWEAFISFWDVDHTEFLPVRKFRDTTENAFYIPSDTPEKKGIDTTEMYWTHFVNAQKFELDGDNFALNAEIKNDHEIVAARCNHAKIFVVGETGQIALYFLKEGCFKWVKLQFGEIKLDGEFQDLSAFGKSLMNWQNITLQVSNKKANVLFNNKLIFEQEYNQSLGEIRAIVFQFSGTAGAVRNIELTTD
ncbi:hypothetical protein [Flexithrix dorotheae]|uniref:hypothetical protein n=1 Tax=Flexithrix dorotheae TaxID=70993 RepID=UPI00037EDE89|nr:hypothetical protein [Flexithrix dorotheae]